MKTINFHEIAPRNGSLHDSFEELCCQLALLAKDKDSTFDRFRGSGGDGGVECIERTKDGRVMGWQAKYIFPIKRLIDDADKSLTTALENHADLTEFILCYPFNPTSRTGRKTKTELPASSELDKLNAWVEKRCQQVQTTGRQLTITLKSASLLESLLHQYDASGGLREYFFNATILSPEWFDQHIRRAVKSVGLRYSPKLKLDTPLYRWFEAFSAGSAWRQEVQRQLSRLNNSLQKFHSMVHSINTGANQVLLDTKQTTELILACVAAGKEALDEVTEQSLATWAKVVGDVLDEHRSFAFELRSKYQEESPLLPSLASLTDWLASRACWLGFHRTFVLTGEGGSGKTHGICDMALKRLETGAYSCALFGHQFDGQPTDWVRMAEALGLPSSLRRDAMLDALNAAAEASGEALIIWIDAINETIPRDYWRKHLKSFAEHVAARPRLRLCVSCRTSFTPISLPEAHGYWKLEHHGFAGMERQACKAFFEHYRLEPPLTPILQPELGNPLYLKLVCETLKARGEKHLPPGWFGVASVINAFLAEKEKRFAEDHASLVTEGARTIRRSLHAIASKMAELQKSRLLYSEAEDAIRLACPHAMNLGVLSWLIRADLLIEEGSADFTEGDFETELLLVFERLSDFLVANGMMPGAACRDPKAAIASSDALKILFQDSLSVERHAGWIAALSMLFADRWGEELPLLLSDADVRTAVLPISMRALAWRSPTGFNASTRQLGLLALFEGSDAMRDSLLRVACLPSAIDALWFHKILSETPIWKRDPFWCRYLLNSHERNGSVTSLIAAADNSDLAGMSFDLALRWALLLCWFTATADRRVKDKATRALTKVFCIQPSVINETVSMMQDVDDDDLIERTLLSAYGALLIKRDVQMASLLAQSLLEAYRDHPEHFQNAQIRDLIRCIGELAQHLGGKLEGVAPSLATKRRKTSWAPEMPNKEEMAQWKDWQGERTALKKAVHSCMDDDFNHYSI